MTTVEERLLANPFRNGRFYTIAIDGRAGSGKSTLAKLFVSLLPGYTHMNGDDYFEPAKDEIVWGSFNDKRFIHEVVGPLKNGNTITYRPYDWHTNPPISQKKITIQKGLCLDRCYSFKFNFKWDLKIWVETPRDICLKRGVARERLPQDTVLKTWRDVWQPLEDAYIAEYLPVTKADVIFDGTKPFKDQLNKF